LVYAGLLHVDRRESGIEPAQVCDHGAADLGFRVGGGAKETIARLPARHAAGAPNPKPVRQGAGPDNGGFVQLHRSQTQPNRLEARHAQGEDKRDGGCHQQRGLARF
jgi:hypothetical protein